MGHLMHEPVGGYDPGLQTALKAAGLPTDDLEDAGRAFYRFVDGTETIGFGGLEHHGSHALLRSVVVLQDYRGLGLGRAITLKLLEQAKADGAQAVYLLTETAAPLFEGCGFRKIAREAAPAEILATRQAASLCPASAALMMRDLPA